MAEQNCINPEVWKPVFGYEGVYEISDRGRLKRVGKSTGAQVGRIVRPCNGGGWSDTRYVSYNLWRKNHGTAIRAHRLVYEAFVGPIPVGSEINHINSNKQDNRPQNLEAITHLANMEHASRSGSLLRGEKIKQSKLTVDEVLEIRALYKPGKMGCIRLGKLYGVGGVSIWNIVTRRSWAHV